MMPYFELPDRPQARRGGTALTPVAVLPAGYTLPLEMIGRPLPVDPSWDLEEFARLDVYQDILGFGGISTPAINLPPPVVQPASGPAFTSTTVLAEVILQMTAVTFLVAMIMVPAGCAFVAQTLYVNPRDGPQRLDVGAAPVAAAIA